MDETSARQWPLPERGWLMQQVWHDLLFAHWEVPAERLRALLPERLPLDTYDGRGWVGIVPFHMSHVRPRRAPAVPWLSAFPELNVRTYVTLDGKPGVYFFSLDAANPAAVWAARRFYHLPYFTASMRVTPDGDAICYRSARRHRGAPPAALRVTYRPAGPVQDYPPDALDRWLTDRYCLYTTDERGRVIRQEIDHPRWPLQPAEATFERNTMTRPIGIDVTGQPPLLHFSKQVKVLIWSQERR
jgi:uncharacterized protein YqjF (DUF2071 family)